MGCACKEYLPERWWQHVAHNVLGGRAPSCRGEKSDTPASGAGRGADGTWKAKRNGRAHEVHLSGTQSSARRGAAGLPSKCNARHAFAKRQSHQNISVRFVAGAAAAGDASRHGGRWRHTAGFGLDDGAAGGDFAGGAAAGAGGGDAGVGAGTGAGLHGKACLGAGGRPLTGRLGNPTTIPPIRFPRFPVGPRRGAAGRAAPPPGAPWPRRAAPSWAGARTSHSSPRPSRRPPRRRRGS